MTFDSKNFQLYSFLMQIIININVKLEIHQLYTKLTGFQFKFYISESVHVHVYTP